MNRCNSSPKEAMRRPVAISRSPSEGIGFTAACGGATAHSPNHRFTRGRIRLANGPHGQAPHDVFLDEETEDELRQDGHQRGGRHLSP